MTAAAAAATAATTADNDNGGHKWRWKENRMGIWYTTRERFTHHLTGLAWSRLYVCDSVRHNQRLQSRLENAHFSPALPQSADADSRRVGRATNVFDLKQLVLTAKREEMCEERVEMRFGT
jgi:hypothetical protein